MSTLISRVLTWLFCENRRRSGKGKRFVQDEDAKVATSRAIGLSTLVPNRGGKVNFKIGTMNDFYCRVSVNDNGPWSKARLLYMTSSWPLLTFA